MTDLLGAATAPDRFRTTATEGSATDDAPFVLDAAILGSPSVATHAASRHDRFGWVFLLIAFAGLTAVFARKPTRGRGLIAAG